MNIAEPENTTLTNWMSGTKALTGIKAEKIAGSTVRYKRQEVTFPDWILKNNSEGAATLRAISSCSLSPAKINSQLQRTPLTTAFTRRHRSWRCIDDVYKDAVSSICSTTVTKQSSVRPAARSATSKRRRCYIPENLRKKHSFCSTCASGTSGALIRIDDFSESSPDDRSLVKLALRVKTARDGWVCFGGWTVWLLPQ